MKRGARGLAQGKSTEKVSHHWEHVIWVAAFCLLSNNFVVTAKAVSVYGSAHLFKNPKMQSSHCCTAETNTASIHEDAGSVPGLPQRVRNLALL